MKKMVIHSLSCFLAIAIVFFSSCKEAPKPEPNDIGDIKQMMQEYREAWRKGDSARVLAKLSTDIILFQPGKTGKPISNKQNVSEFWFPKSDIKYPIISYQVENEEVVSSGEVGYYQGLSKLPWCTVENKIARDTMLSVSEFTNILKKEGNQWKIHRIMYNLKDTEYN